MKAGAETDKKDVDGFLAMDLSPDAQVRWVSGVLTYSNKRQVRKYILQSAEREGIEL